MIDPGAARRAHRWSRDTLASVCDVSEPWEHGTVLRATRYPGIYDFNVVRVEDDPKLGVEELIAVADERLAGLEHRRLDFEREEAADAVRAHLEAAGWRTNKLLWMLHTEPLPPGPGVEVEEVNYDAVHDLRVAWHHEDFPPELDPSDYLAGAREVALTRNVQVIAAREGGELVGYAQLVRIGGSAEVEQVYVRPEHRGGGRGTAMTRAAIEAAGDARELWLVAEAEGRPKDLYARLGFRPAWTSVEFLRLPGA